jgi:hypothetical protein
MHALQDELGHPPTEAPLDLDGCPDSLA